MGKMFTGFEEEDGDRSKDIEIEEIYAFDIFILVNKEWVLVNTYELNEDDRITIDELDVYGNVVDSNQHNINEEVKRIIDEIINTGTILPDEKYRENPNLDYFYIGNVSNMVIRIVAKTDNFERSFKIEK